MKENKASVIAADAYRLVTQPYLKEDLARIDKGKAFSITRKNIEKIVAEEPLDSIRTTDLKELRDKVIDLCLRQRPYPIVVKLQDTTLNRQYIVDKRFKRSDPEAIWENIIYGYNKTGREILNLIYNRLSYPPVEADQISAANKELVTELKGRFGVELDAKRPLDAYTSELIYHTSEEIDRISGNPNISTVALNYIQELARLITKGSQTKVDYIEYLSRNNRLAEMPFGGSIINYDIPPPASAYSYPGRFPPPQTRLS